MWSPLASAAVDVAALVLATSGAIKVARPAGFGALSLGGARPIGSAVARLVGGAELAVAAAVLVWGSALTLVGMSALYTAFAAITASGVRRSAPSCGCFGERSAPPSGLHVALDLAAAAAAAALALDPAPGIVDRLADLGAVVAAEYVVFAALGAVVVVVAMTSSGELLAARRALRPARPGTRVR